MTAARYVEYAVSLMTTRWKGAEGEGRARGGGIESAYSASTSASESSNVYGSMS